jgi:hypothetical protein
MDWPLTLVWEAELVKHSLSSLTKGNDHDGLDPGFY